MDEDSAFCEYCGANMDAGAALTESSGPNVFAKNATRGNRVSEKVTPIDIGASSGPEFAPEEVRAREEQAVTPKIATPEIVVANEPYLSQVSPVYVQEVDIQDQDGVLSERFLRSKVVAAGATPPMVSAHEAEPSKWKWWHALFAAGLFIFIIAIIGAGALYLWLQRSPSVKSSSQSSPSSYRAEATLPIPEGMVYVRGGTFLMGRDDGDEYERPAHKVTVAPFFLDKFEVTCEQYQKFLDATQRVAPTSWRAGRFPAGAAKLPVTGVTWDDANAYAGWAGKRLPTEEEWEFAARGSSGGKYPWGKEWRAKAANAGDSSAGRLADVGSYPDGNSSDGVMDLIGNAWEWTSSDLAAYPGGQLSSISRKDLKVIRGGSWKEEKDEATVTYRGYLASRGAKDYSATGFRCVKESDITSKQD
ncbi:MAG TPA: SUMF1/EgtB/PvdO family nonheme iron enzyme [Pyrinomonadaceae bacterium]|nr:SUMF1/EgtB/PvdO family nonheme iron enzyme [Pyrinomonadaceae bacterium]